MTRSVWMGVVAPLVALVTVVAAGGSGVDVSGASPQGSQEDARIKTVALHVEGMT